MCRARMVYSYRGSPKLGAICRILCRGIGLWHFQCFALELAILNLLWGSSTAWVSSRPCGLEMKLTSKPQNKHNRQPKSDNG